MNLVSPVLHSTYNYLLVFISVVISILASYTALELGGRVTSSHARARNIWLAGGAVTMGIGIWSMHYVGMLALRLPNAVQYDWPTVLVSLLAAIVASGIALFVVSRRTMNLSDAIVASLFMGSAIAGMHYIGMAAMRMPAMCHYSVPVVTFSVFLAVVISFVALWLTFYVRTETNSFSWRKLLSALVMGVAVPIMHYTGMAAVSFTAAKSTNGNLSHALSITTLGTSVVILVTLLILGLTVLTSTVGRYFSKQALELELNENRFRQTLETSFDAFVGMNALGRIIDWNGQAERTFGITREEVKDQSLSQTIIPAHCRNAYEKEIEQLVVTDNGVGTSRRFEIMAARRDGREFLSEMTVSIIRNESTCNLAAFIRDLSQRESAKEKFRGLLDATSEAIIFVNSEGRIRVANRRAETLFGLSQEELLNRQVESLLPERSRNRHPELRQKFFDGSQVRLMGTGVQLSALHKDGHEFPVDISLTPIETEDGPMVSTMILDISERKRNEQALRDSKEAAEAASEAKSSFLANMSHEIRTPMNGILGMTELVLDTELTAEQREQLGLVRISAESLLDIINDILDFSKIEAGKLKLESIPFHLRESLGDCMKTLSLRAQQKGIEVVYDVRPEVPEALLGDPARVQQILINLVGNSIKFTEQGEIVVTVEQQSETADQTELHFSVQDTGIGIATEKQSAIFEAFSQADGSMSRRYGGTGLGLSISKQLIGLMGGRIWVASQPGHGSTFHFLIRLAVQETPAGRLLLTNSQELHDVRVLVVDDNFTNRRVLDEMLIRFGMRPTSVAGGAAGIATLASAKNSGDPFALVLLDAHMPEMDGFTFAETVRSDISLLGSILMMLTSAGQLGDAAKCRELGISGYLVKPIRQQELLEGICALLGLKALKKPEALITRQSLREEVDRGRVLLAEDNLVNQKLAVRLLEKRGFHVTVVGNGRAAIQALTEDLFDIVLMDVQMPEMDGFSATAAIREKEKTTQKHIPIIAMTAHALVGDEERCMAAGMDGYVSKPIRTDELFATIEKLIRNRDLADASKASDREQKVEYL